MKKKFSILIFIAVSLQTASAQNNSLIVYSQEGFKFSVILNGILQNDLPATNVKVTGLNAPNYQTKIIFDNKMPDLDQNVYLIYGGEPTQNTEYTYAIEKIKEKYKLKFKSAAPVLIAPNTAPEPQQTVVIYTPVERTTTTTTSTTTNTMGTNNGNLAVNVNGVNMNINVNDGSGMGAATTSSTTTTYSSTTTTTSGSSGMNQGSTYVLQGYDGIYGCPYPMSESDFESAKASIKSKAFDESKLTLAKQIIGSNCMLCSQIKEVMLLITFEATRLDLAKFAWHHNLDKGNYYKLNDAFTFESSINELNQYTQNH